MLRSLWVANFSLIQFIVYIHQCIEHLLFIEQRKLISFKCQADRNTILEMPIDLGLTPFGSGIVICYQFSWAAAGAARIQMEPGRRGVIGSLRPSGPFRCWTRTSVYSIIVIIACLVSGRKQRPMPAPLPSRGFAGMPPNGAGIDK